MTKTPEDNPQEFLSLFNYFIIVRLNIMLHIEVLDDNIIPNDVQN